MRGSEVHDEQWLLELGDSLVQYVDKASQGKLQVEVDVELGVTPTDKFMKEFSDRHDDGRTRQLVEEILYRVNDRIDFSAYDQIVMLYAGVAGSSVDDNIIAQNRTMPTILDCKLFPNVILSPESKHLEFDSNMFPEHSGILSTHGTLAHEFMHSLGARDLYPSVYEGLLSPQDRPYIGAWGLMSNIGSSGGRGKMPVDISAWHKLQFGWYDELEIIRGSDIGDELVRVDVGVDKLVILEIMPPKDPTDPKRLGAEYFLVENRQKKGLDEALPGEGLLVWHIKEPTEPTGYPIVRLVEAHEGARDLLQATGTPESVLGGANDPFYAGNKTVFATSTDPSSHDMEGNPTWVSIVSVTGPQDVMSFWLGASPTDIYVAPHGSDVTGGGTKKHPFATIERAREMIGARRDVRQRVTIRLQPGTYPISLFEIIHEDYVTVRGEGDGPEAVVLDGGGDGSGIVINADHVWVQNLTIRQTKLVALEVVDTLGEDRNTHARITDVVVEDSQGDGIDFAGHSHQLNRVVVRGSGVHGIRVDNDSSDIDIIGSEIVNSGGAGIFVDKPDSIADTFTQRKISLQGVTIQGNHIGIQAKHYLPGIKTQVVVSNSHIRDQVGDGIVIESPSGRNLFARQKSLLSSAVTQEGQKYEFSIMGSTFLDNGHFHIRNGDSTSIVSASANYWGSRNPEIIAAMVDGPNIDVSDPWASTGSSVIAPVLDELIPSKAGELDQVSLVFAPSAGFVDGAQFTGEETVRYRVYRFVGEQPAPPFDLIDVRGWDVIEPNPQDITQLDDGRLVYHDSFAGYVPDGVASSKNATATVQEGSLQFPYHYVVTAYVDVVGRVEGESAPSNVKEIVLGNPAPWEQGSWHVDGTRGSDDSDRANGSPTLPFLTIAKALEKAEEGHQIYLADGVYREHVLIQTNGIALIGNTASPDKVVIEGLGMSDHVTSGVKVGGDSESDPIVSGVSIRGITVTNSWFGIWVRAAEATVIEDCVLRANRTGISFHKFSRSTRMSRCDSHDNQWSGFHSYESEHIVVGIQSVF